MILSYSPQECIGIYTSLSHILVKSPRRAVEFLRGTLFFWFTTVPQPAVELIGVQETLYAMRRMSLEPIREAMEEAQKAAHDVIPKSFANVQPASDRYTTQLRKRKTSVDK